MRAPLRSRRSKTAVFFAVGLDFFVCMIIPTSHADWAGESPQKGLFGYVKGVDGNMPEFPWLVIWLIG